MTPVTVPGERIGYDLLESNGLVAGFGGAGAYGPTRPIARGAVALTVTVDGAGYWVLSANGTVHSYGDAIAYGEPTHLVTGRTVAIVPTPDGGGYWLLTAKGGLDNFGDAPFCGSAVHTTGTGRYVAMAPTPDGDGYWLVTDEGVVRAFGDARVLAPTGNTAPAPALTGGSGASGAGAGAASGSASAPAVVSLAVTPDGGGYWLLSANGSVRAYGDARYYGGGGAKKGVGQFAGIAATLDGKGYWLATSTGHVFQFGDATAEGSLAHHPPKPPVHVVAFTAAVVPPPTSTPGPGASGSGTTTTSTTSTSTSTSTSTTTSSTTTTTLPRRPGSSTTTTRPRSHTSTTTTLARRSSTTTRPTSPTSTTTPRTGRSTTTTTTPGGVRVEHGAFGYDISDFQCARPGSAAARTNLPAHSGISVIQVAGWLDSGANPCLGAEASWAERAAGTKATPYQLYLFMNSPGLNSVAIEQSAKGPAGNCARLAPAARPSCIAYNYGYNGAVSALAYAASRGVHAAEWWLDVENSSLSRSAYSNFAAGEYWSGSTALNDRTIGGALDALHRAGVVVGIYSTSVQYPRIAGKFVPAGPRMRLWVAGVPWTAPPFTERGLYPPSVLRPWCAGTAGYVGYKHGELFAGGIVQLLQETPGTEPSPYGLDPDYAC
jgi:hypothetical protein